MARIIKTGIIQMANKLDTGASVEEALCSSSGNARAPGYGVGSAKQGWWSQ